MGREKDRIIRADQAQHDAARRDSRRCPYCSAVIPYGTNPGVHGECPACVGALKDD